MADVRIGSDLLLNRIVINAGGDPARSRYNRQTGVLTVPDVTQPALDAAVAGYDDAAERVNERNSKFDVVDNSIITKLTATPVTPLTREEVERLLGE